MKKFWIVLGQGKRIAEGFQAYDNPEFACAEAARLTRKERMPMIVLEAMWQVEVVSPEPPLKWTELKKEEKHAETEEDPGKY